MMEPGEGYGWLLRPGVAFAILIAYPICTAIYHAFFDKLSHIPGPHLWASSRLPYIRSLLSGTIVQDVEKLHHRYGPAVRIAPNEVSFASPESWVDILTVRPGHAHFIKDPTWWAQQPGRPQSLLSTPSIETHARMRKTLSHGFTESALKAQETILQRQVALLISQLQIRIKESKKAGGAAILDVVPWFNYTAFDIFGDLAFGESFECLQHSRLHPWIETLFYSVKAAAFVISARFYPLVEFFLMKCIPQSMMEKQRNQYKYISDKVQSRFNWEVARPDLMEYVIKNNDKAGMTIPEIQSTFAFLTNAGSETTATTLSGTINYLISCPDKLRVLTQELREAFSNEDSIALEELGKLPYLNAVINEGLRLCPPVPTILPRLVPHGGDQVSGVWLPGGTSLSLSVWTIHHSPQLFHQSTSFLPERWLAFARGDAASPFHEDCLSAVKPFSVGPRSCLGQKLAWAEIRLVLARLVWSFDVSRGVESEQDLLRWDRLKCFLLWEKEPVLVKLTERK